MSYPQTLALYAHLNGPFLTQTGLILHPSRVRKHLQNLGGIPPRCNALAVVKHGPLWHFVTLCGVFFQSSSTPESEEEAGAERGSNPRKDRTHVYVFLRRKSTSEFFILLRSIKNKVQFWVSILRRLATLAACWGGPHPNFDQAEHEHIQKDPLAQTRCDYFEFLERGRQLNIEPCKVHFILFLILFERGSRARGAPARSSHVRRPRDNIIDGI